jgi:hypothetical protein
VSGTPRFGVERAPLGLDLDLTLRKQIPEEVRPYVKEKEIDDLVTLESARGRRRGIDDEAVRQLVDERSELCLSVIARSQLQRMGAARSLADLRSKLARCEVQTCVGLKSRDDLVSVSGPQPLVFSRRRQDVRLQCRGPKRDLQSHIGTTG